MTWYFRAKYFGAQYFASGYITGGAGVVAGIGNYPIFRRRRPRR